MKQCSPVNSPTNSRKRSFAGSPAVVGKSKKKTQRRIDSFRFFIPPPITVKEETGDGRTETTEQTPTTRQQEETHSEPQLNHRPPTEHEEPNSQPRLADFGLGVSAHQPRSFRFPRRQFGKSKPVFRSFQVAWFDSWRWLHYVEDEDKVICHTCTRAHRTHQLATLMVDAAFITKGYTNLKDATRKKAGFSQHERSQCHREAVERGITLHATTKDVGEHISSAHEEDKANNRKALMKILSNIRFLARQGIPLRGDGDGNNSNFTQIFHLRTEDNPALSTWLVKKTNKYSSWQMQNEMLKVMAL